MNNMNNKKNRIKQLRIKIKNFLNYLIMYKYKLMKLYQNIYLFNKIHYMKVKNLKHLIKIQVKKRKKKIVIIYNKLKIFLLILKTY